jgi:transposase
VIAITSKMRISIALEPVDMRNRIDGLVRLVRSKLSADPFSGVIFVFRSRAGRDIVLLKYDGQGFVLTQKRLSEKTFPWPTSTVADEKTKTLLAHELHTLIWGGDPATGIPAPMWRPIPTEDDATVLSLFRPPSIPAAPVPVNAYAARASFSGAAASSAGARFLAAAASSSASVSR